MSSIPVFTQVNRTQGNASSSNQQQPWSQDQSMNPASGWLSGGSWSNAMTKSQPGNAVNGQKTQTTANPQLQQQQQWSQFYNQGNNNQWQQGMNPQWQFANQQWNNGSNASSSMNQQAANAGGTWGSGGWNQGYGNTQWFGGNSQGTASNWINTGQVAQSAPSSSWARVGNAGPISNNAGGDWQKMGPRGAGANNFRGRGRADWRGMTGGLRGRGGPPIRGRGPMFKPFGSPRKIFDGPANKMNDADKAPSQPFERGMPRKRPGMGYEASSAVFPKKRKARPDPPTADPNATPEELREVLISKLNYARQFASTLKEKCSDRADLAQKIIQLANIKLEQTDVRTGIGGYTLIIAYDVILFIGRGNNKRHARKDAMELACDLFLNEGSLKDHTEFSIVETTAGGEWILDIPRNQEFYTAMKMQKDMPPPEKPPKEPKDQSGTALSKPTNPIEGLIAACDHLQETEGSVPERVQKAFTNAKQIMLRMSFEAKKQFVVCHMDFHRIWYASGRGRNKAEARTKAYKMVIDNMMKPVGDLKIYEVDGVERFWYGDEESLKEYLAKEEKFYADQKVPPKEPMIKEILDGRNKRFHSGRRTYEITRDFAKQYADKPIRYLILDKSFVCHQTPICRLQDIAQINRTDLSVLYDSNEDDKKITCNVHLGPHVLATATCDTREEARDTATKAALAKLEETCPMIRVKRLFSSDDRITKDELASSNNSAEAAGEEAASQDKAISSENKGHRLLSLMGWSGGSLGADKEGADPGLIDPVAIRGQTTTKGLGFADDEFELQPIVSQVFKEHINILLDRFVKDSDICDDLVFSPEFTIEEREYIHHRARYYHLKSRSRNQECGRVLCVSHNVDWWQLYELLLKDPEPYSNKYELIQPAN